MYVRSDPKGSFRAVPESKLYLDSYPAPSGAATDADKVAGFTQRQSLRLLVLLYPNALCASSGADFMNRSVKTARGRP